MTGSGNLLELRDVSKRYRIRDDEELVALSSTSFDVRQGEFLSIIGPSGCGKSTLLALAAGLRGCTTGAITAPDGPISGPRDWMGFVFQRDGLLEWRTALGNVLLPVDLRKGLKRADYIDRAKFLLTRVGLENFMDYRPGSLSGGMRQRVALCRALITEPQFLLMDEPFGALDALTRERLMLDSADFLTNRGRTVLFVTHSIEEAAFLSDRVVVMGTNPGHVRSIVQVDADRPRTEQYLSSSAHSETAAHLRELLIQYGAEEDARQLNTSRGSRV